MCVCEGEGGGGGRGGSGPLASDPPGVCFPRAGSLVGGLTFSSTLI